LELGFDSAEEPAVPTQVVVTEKPDDFVGRYKLLEKVGEGGCGVVYVAEQTAPVRRRVALKVIKLGMDTKQVVARFEAERQALAMMDHPNIAKVHDAGSTETGRPYFVMELVRGIRITEYCDQAQLSTKERLDLFIKVCQKSEIGSLAVSADANWLAIGLVHRDGAYVWDLKTRQEVAHLAAGEAKVRLAFSPSEALLAFTSDLMPESGKEENTLRFWDGNARQTVAEFPLRGLCLGLSFSSDGRVLATSTSQEITLWHVPDGTKIATYAFQRRAVDSGASFATTADMSLAAFEGGAGLLRVISLHDGKEVWSAAASKDYLPSLSFSPDGKTLATGGGLSDSDIRLWEAASGKELGRLKGHKSWVSALVFWPDGKRLASSSADQTIRIWDVEDRKCLDELRGHVLEVWRLALAPDQKTLVSGCKDGTVCLWDTSGLHPSCGPITLPEAISSWCFSPDSRSIVTVDLQGDVRRWSGPGFQQRESWIEPGPRVYNSVFSRDGRLVAITFTNGNMKVWDLARRTVVHECRGEEKVQGVRAVLLDGKRLIVQASGSEALREWDLEANREIQSWPVPLGFQWFEISPDEQFGLAVGLEGRVLCRNLTERTTQVLSIDALEGWQIAFQPDGKRMVISSAQGYARVWDTATWREEATLRGFLNAVSAAAFSPDKSRLVLDATSPEDMVQVWDTESWQELLTLEGTGNISSRTAFSPDGNLIGAVNLQNTLQIWRAPSWEEIKAAEAR
jgi:WD40 repeat protein